MKLSDRKSSRPRVYADFQKIDGDGERTWIVLVCRGTFDDLAKLGIELREGLELMFYMDDADDHGNSDDLECDGSVHYHSAKGHWIGVLDEATWRHASERLKP